MTRFFLLSGFVLLFSLRPDILVSLRPDILGCICTDAPGEGPIRVGIPVVDLTAGLFCIIGILTALLERDFSGEGQWVQASSRAVLSQPPRCPRDP